MVNLRPLKTPKRLFLISGALKSQKGVISGPWNSQKVREILYGSYSALRHFSFLFQLIFTKAARSAGVIIMSRYLCVCMCISVLCPCVVTQSGLLMDKRGTSLRLLWKLLYDVILSNPVQISRQGGPTRISHVLFWCSCSLKGYHLQPWFMLLHAA